MCLPSIGFLGNQLLTIEKFGYRQLVSNYSCTALYPINSWTGKFWTWIYYFTGHQKEKLFRCIDNIFIAYRNYMELAKAHDAVYRDFTANKEIDPFKLAAARKGLYDFYRMTRGLTPKPFLSIILTESHMKLPFPVGILSKYARDFELDPSEEKELALWIQRFRDLKLPIQWLHESLCRIVHKPGYAERKLNSEFDNLFAVPDPDHLAWRKSLKPGNAVTFNGRRLILDQKLGEEKENDCRVYFKVKNEENKVLLIGLNRASPGIREEIIDEMAWGIEPAKILELDIERGIALIEQLATPLTEKHIPLLTEWINWLKEEDGMPHEFTAKHFMFDTNGVLRSTKPLYKSNFNPELAQKLIDEVKTPF